MLQVAQERFEQLVADALDRLPDELGRLMDNVWVTVDDRHPEEDLLGLYDGVPLTERADYGGMALPDRITIYRLPICEECETEAEVVETVVDTVIHEVAHHFGIDDERLTDLGWG